MVDMIIDSHLITRLHGFRPCVLVVLIWIISTTCYAESLGEGRRPRRPSELEQNTSIDLKARALPGKVQLKWIVDPWPANFAGFIVQRRLAHAEKPWKRLTPDPIEPQSSVFRNWSLVTKEVPQQQLLKKRLERMVDEGRMHEMDADAFRLELINNPQKLLELNNAFENTWLLPMVLGFGIEDDSLTKAGLYEYGLFAVLDGGEMEQEPQAICQVQVDDPEGYWLKLYAERSGEKVKLLWLPYGWDANVRAVRVVRALVDEKGKQSSDWQTVLTAPIAPGIMSDADWQTRGLDMETAKRLQAYERRMLLDGSLPSLSTETAVKRMSEMASQDLAGDRIKLAQQYETALLTGFACEDPRVPESACIYGLLAVHQDGSIADKPITTARPERTDILFEMDRPSARRIKNGVLIKWQCDAKRYNDAALWGFNLYRRNPNKQSWEKLNVTPLGAPETGESIKKWEFQDTKADVSKLQQYALRPVTVFQQEKPFILFRYIPEPEPAERYAMIPQPVITTLTQPREIGVEIAWELQNKGKDPAGFSVERVILPDRELEIIAPDLSGSTRSFFDHTCYSNGVSVGYRITALDEKGAPLRNSPMKIGIYVDRRKPAPPEELHAEYDVETDCIRMSWIPHENPEVPVSGYYVYADRLTPGEVVRMASVPLITNTTYELPVGGPRGREFTVGIASRSEYGQEGTLTEASCYIPARKVDRIRSVELVPDGNRVVLQWEYPESSQLTGFRIRANGEVVAQLPALLRTWTSDRLSPNALHTFAVQAVWNDTMASRWSKEQEFYYIDKETP